MSALTKKKLIYQWDLEDANVLANHHPDPDLFYYSPEEIADLVEGLIGTLSMKRGIAGCNSKSIRFVISLLWPRHRSSELRRLS